ncbi:lipid IV(A) 3-deoxy-D-manno-octulosonic acid transferase [Vibrio europaeus]|uniref:lipid IV(A) 3-deoxy-D-manno-octulosonic acid transferase n=1 Tax=Vibrio europaeus TaxID=300876 RepID=UPI00148CAF57|nr:lipid IV(A) 3-deoxy-D-manno-octulosonic acid transferase [Vibrio europaeus]MDC5837994.1 lipid IV(A) 3-deoxy-D-manno-octulosonic acid transferase [Vibrio europaeus]MDC5855110.1 lipid IV(A) 3-deoxy-D-manno-octulosonic acid transferase [Vibrio europaeus]NOH22754.1 3-deoxy-D-manno-octulosonic acid transferase [Vibrio europaeus]
MIFRLVYTVLLALVSPLFIYSLYKTKSGKPRIGSRWKEHWGVAPTLPYRDRPIWIHAVSMGETIAATPLIYQLKEQHPEINIVLTTTTATGAEQAKRLGKLVTHRYMPFDFPFAINQFLKVMKPRQLIIMETEIWPNTLHLSNHAGIPITIVNARLSNKSCNGYKKIPTLAKQLNRSVTRIVCQYPNDANNFKTLGVRPEKLSVSGSIKFDILVRQETKAKGQTLRKTLGSSRPVWIAASTHEGEDKIVLSAHASLLKHKPDAILILVPRHPERFSKVKSLSEANFPTVSRSSEEKVTSSTQVYLGDTMGEMLEQIEASDICFMGGSLVGDKVGGHNLLEPAALAKATLTGPSFYNFQDIAQALIAHDACSVVKSSEELFESLLSLFNNNSLRTNKGQAALEFVQRNSGAIETTIRLIGNLDNK